MPDPLTLETARMILRPVTEGDLADLVRLYGDPAVTAPAKLSRRSAVETAAILKGYHETWRRRGYGMRLVLSRTDGQVLGECGLFGPDEPGADRPGDAALRYAFFAAHWGKGLAAEAAAAVLDDAFARVGLDRVIAYAQAGNPASIRVMEKLGMTPVAPPPGVTSDILLHEIGKPGRSGFGNDKPL